MDRCGSKRATRHPGGGNSAPAASGRSASFRFAVSARPTLVATSPGSSSRDQVCSGRNW